MFKWYK